MHPRAGFSRWSPSQKARAQALLEFVRERGPVHPREVDAHFSHGSVSNYWGGSSNATTHLLDAMHYRGLLRVARRAGGVRIYEVYTHTVEPLDAAARRERLDLLVDVIVRKYAPLPALSLSGLVRRLRYAVPQWRRRLERSIDARQKAARACPHRRRRLVLAMRRSAICSAAPEDVVRLLTPFDPVVWDRRRFEIFWNWAYRFEAYTPPAKRQLGYYALPLLWRDRVIGWGNISVKERRSACRHRLPESPRRANGCSNASSTRNSIECEPLWDSHRSRSSTSQTMPPLQAHRTLAARFVACTAFPERASNRSLHAVGLCVCRSPM